MLQPAERLTFYFWIKHVEGAHEPAHELRWSCSSLNALQDVLRVITATCGMAAAAETRC